MVKIDNLILGAGIAGLAVGLRLKEKNQDYLIIEKNKYPGGLCASFEIGEFVFDYFIHMSFTKMEEVRKYFDCISYQAHSPNPYNYYHGIWIKHPAINNLYPLSQSEKNLILKDLEKREKYSNTWSSNYDSWLRYQFGDYFAENFSLAYTEKYWVEDPTNMGTKWIADRIYQPSMEEILGGMNAADTPVTYYAKEMRYPTRGGFGKYLESFTDLEKIRLGESIIRINTKDHLIETDQDVYSYKHLYSSIPLPEIPGLIGKESIGYPEFAEAAKALHWTSGYVVSLGLIGEMKRKDLWDYIYDDDIFISRYYSPSLMSDEASPKGCCSIQAEIYTKDGQPHELSQQELLNASIEQLDRIGVINESNIIVKDIRFLKYCNIIFDHNIYKARDVLMKFFNNKKMIPIGRFGTWDYLWSDQSFMSGYNAVNQEVNIYF